MSKKNTVKFTFKLSDQKNGELSKAIDKVVKDKKLTKNKVKLPNNYPTK